MSRCRRLKISDRNWSQVPSDILGLIELRLPVSDTLSFSAVCSWWRVATKNNKRNVPLLLYFFRDRTWNQKKKKTKKKEKDNTTKIVLSPGRQRNHRRHNLQFRSIDYDGDYMLKDITYSSNDINGVVGSGPDGWLVVLDHSAYPYLIKLMPRLKLIRLPKTALLPDGHKVASYTVLRSVLSIDKDDIIVIAIITHHYHCIPPTVKRLAFWRPGHTHWTFVQPHRAYYFDIAFCNTTKTLYALRIEGRFALVEVHSWDLTKIDDPSYAPLILQISCITQEKDDSYIHATRLVLHPITSQILLLGYRGKHKDDPNPRWFILDLDFTQLSCKQLHSFNGEALLLGYASSIFVSSNHKYRANSIYFVEWWTSASVIRLSNYSMEDARLEHLWACSPPGDETHPRLRFSWIVLSI